ncbi:MAG: DUF4124 domain-containing protein [Oceanospirillaceae bacterium]|nr:DUF4124 domain-containing protein [Oceanospirillaceae bacterium]
MKSTVVLAAGLLFVAGTSALAEQVYRWKDESGKWHFSDVPPKGVNAESVKFSNMSVVSMPKPAPRASGAEPGMPPECAPDYRGDGECPDRSRARTQSVQERGKATEVAPEQQRSGQVRKDRLETGAEQIKGYDKSERVKEIEERNEAAKQYERDTPPTLNEKLRARNEKPTPRN